MPIINMAKPSARESIPADRPAERIAYLVKRGCTGNRAEAGTSGFWDA